MNRQYHKPGPVTLVAVAFVCSMLFVGYAGSATHKVLTANQAGDAALSCEEINTEISKAQSVINGINSDKADVSDKDVVDGILWFPFNLIAKHEIYNNALEGADRRIEVLQALKKDKQCTQKEVAAGP